MVTISSDVNGAREESSGGPIRESPQQLYRSRVETIKKVFKVKEMLMILLV
jgi:hypothetical protein